MVAAHAHGCLSLLVNFMHHRPSCPVNRGTALVAVAVLNVASNSTIKAAFVLLQLGLR